MDNSTPEQDMQRLWAAMRNNLNVVKKQAKELKKMIDQDQDASYEAFTGNECLDLVGELKELYEILYDDSREFFK